MEIHVQAASWTARQGEGRWVTGLQAQYSSWGEKENKKYCWDGKLTDISNHISTAEKEVVMMYTASISNNNKKTQTTLSLS